MLASTNEVPEVAATAVSAGNAIPLLVHNNKAGHRDWLPLPPRPRAKVMDLANVEAGGKSPLTDVAPRAITLHLLDLIVERFKFAVPALESARAVLLAQMPRVEVGRPH